MLSTGGNTLTPAKGRKPVSPSRGGEDPSSLPIFKGQLAAYTSWINAQLKKKPGAHLVEDLRHDVRDGVALVDLVEIIGGEKLEDVHKAPSTYSEMRDNVDKVLHFMTSNHIKMHHITARDVIEGNLKAIMRLILALAAHYKPHSVRHSPQINTRQNIAGIVQGASAALTEARRHANKAGHRHRRRRHKEDHRGSHGYSASDHAHTAPSLCHNCRTNTAVISSSSDTFSRGAHSQNRPPSHHRLSQSSLPRNSGVTPSVRENMEGEDGGGGGGGRAELEGASGSSSPVNSYSTSPRMSLYLSDPPSSMEGLLMSGGALMSASCESDSLTDSGFVELRDSVTETHKMLLNLHDLLLNGNAASSHNGIPDLVQGSNSQEKMVILNERLLHTEEMIGALRSELNKTKKDCMELQATKVGLEQRVGDKERQLTQAKAEQMKMDLEKQNALLEMDAIKKQLLDREQLLSDMKVSFAKQMQEKDQMLANFRKEIKERDQSLEMLREKVNFNDKSLTTSSTSLDGNTKNLPGDATSNHNGVRAGTGGPPMPSSMSRSHQTMRSSNVTPRATPGRTTPTRGRGRAKAVTVTRSGQQMSSMRSNDVTPRQTRPGTVPSAPSQASGPRSGIPVPNGGGGGGGGGGVRCKNANSSSSDSQTQVLYYLDSSDKPYSCNIPKRLGEITLRDFKDLIEDPGCYHFYFKVLDPEYGTVKEELSRDEDVLPGWQGRIVAWLEVESITV